FNETSNVRFGHHLDELEAAEVDTSPAAQLHQEKQFSTPPFTNMVQQHQTILSSSSSSVSVRFPPFI
ncbi:MAG: hypothetical protein Q7T57_02870, partial [Dehalococcoidales bacterium]|nr:hypothetical protein [Dehalococcoidales bacterium]